MWLESVQRQVKRCVFVNGCGLHEDLLGPYLLRLPDSPFDCPFPAWEVVLIQPYQFYRGQGLRRHNSDRVK